MRYSRQRRTLGTRRSTLVAVLLAAGTMTGGLLAQSSDAGASSGPKGTITVGSKTYKMSFVSCLSTRSHLQTAMGGGGNTVEMAGKVHKGKFSQVIMGATIAGTDLLIVPNSGTVNSHGGTFKGVAGSTKVKGSYNC
jgi:hypothetical protein